jgi:predicted negative regulator of RcsB-dependent stress response
MAQNVGLSNDQKNFNMDDLAQLAVKNSGVIGAILGAAFVVGLAATIYSMINTNSEEKVQVKLAPIEESYFEKKGKKITDAKAVVDLSQEEAQLKDLYATSSKFIGGQVAGLYLADLYLDSGKSQDAIEILKKVFAEPANDLLRAISGLTLGNVLSSNGNCQDALSTFEKLEKSSASQFVQSEVKLKKAKCMVQVGDIAKAESLLNEVSSTQGSNDSMDSMQASESQAYLRLLKVKKNFKL